MTSAGRIVLTNGEALPYSRAALDLVGQRDGAVVGEIAVLERLTAAEQAVLEASVAIDRARSVAA